MQQYVRRSLVKNRNYLIVKLIIGKYCQFQMINKPVISFIFSFIGLLRTDLLKAQYLVNNRKVQKYPLKFERVQLQVEIPIAKIQYNSPNKIVFIGNISILQINFTLQSHSNNLKTSSCILSLLLHQFMSLRSLYFLSSTFYTFY